MIETRGMENKNKNKNIHAKRFAKQILLMRYKLLLQKLQKTYNLNQEKMAKLEERILNVDWFGNH